MKKKKILLALGIIFFGCLVGFPVYWMIICSLKSNVGISLPSRLIPKVFHWGVYKQVLFKLNFLEYFQHSICVTIPAVFMTVFLGVFSGYAISRLKFKGKRTISTLFLSTYAIPPILLIIPLYIYLAKLQLINSLPVIIVVYLSRTLPLSIYLFVGYFQTLPPELENAARIDGCSRLQTIRHVILPLSLPVIVAVSTYAFMICWNEYIFASTFLRPDKYTLPVGLHHMYASVHASWNAVMAGSVIIAIPVLAVFIFLERYLIRGLTAGALKG